MPKIFNGYLQIGVKLTKRKCVSVVRVIEAYFDPRLLRKASKSSLLLVPAADGCAVNITCCPVVAAGAGTEAMGGTGGGTAGEGAAAGFTTGPPKRSPNVLSMSATAVEAAG